ncbi:MAG: PKD domain-containing protein [Deltaproteobacteria bacterium]|nr:PKD domain-containing protein [Deltaproteobacteria bacterium]
MSYRLLALILALGLLSCGDSKTRTYENLPPEPQIEGGDRQGLVGEPLAFDGRASKDPDGTLASLTWDFGDGGQSSEAMASHTYLTAGSYTVTLTATDDVGASGSAVVRVSIAAKQVNQPPVPAILGDTTLEVAQLGSFDARGSTDPDGAIASYAWGFGDGATGTGTQVQHAWGRPGTYDITLVVTDNQGATATAKLTLVVQAKANRPPVADPGANKTAHPDEQVAFDGSASLDPDGTIASYEWDFGDGSTKATTALATHAYVAVGRYTVSLKVTDDQGATGTATAEVDVQPLAYSGTYAVNADPAEAWCSITKATWIPTQLVLTISGTTATADEIIPPDATPKIHYSGTWTEATRTFHMTGDFNEGMGIVHHFTYHGTFQGTDTFTGTDTEQVVSNGLPLCTIEWQVTGTR